MYSINDGTLVPRRMTTHSSGYDFYAGDTYELNPGEWTTILTGVAFDGMEKPRIDGSPMGQWFMLLAPRSGLGVKYGFRIKNTLGIIDQDYRNQIMATVTVDVPYILVEGERFMQGIILPYGVFDNEIEPTDKRSGGHGSTGLS